MTPSPPPDTAVQRLRQEIEQALRNLPMGLTVQGTTDAVTPILERLCTDPAAELEKLRGHTGTLHQEEEEAARLRAEVSRLTEQETRAREIIAHTLDRAEPLATAVNRLRWEHTRYVAWLRAAITEARTRAAELGRDARTARARGNHGEANRLDSIAATIRREADRFEAAVNSGPPAPRVNTDAAEYHADDGTVWDLRKVYVDAEGRRWLWLGRVGEGAHGGTVPVMVKEEDTRQSRPLDLLAAKYGPFTVRELPDPSGCRHCGLGRQWHGRAWVSGVGSHGWTTPTGWQRKARMTARRMARPPRTARKLP